MPLSSSAFTRLASVYRAGGWVTCALAVTSDRSVESPTVIGGRRGSFSLTGWSSETSSSLPSWYAWRNPRSLSTVPEALKSAALKLRPSRDGKGLASSVAVTVSPFASTIWLATVRFQIRSYSFNSSERSTEDSCDGVGNASPAGRTASWASWAFLDLPL